MKKENQTTVIKTFKSLEFGEIRTAINENGETLFCLVDLCNALNLSNSRRVSQRIDDDERCNLELRRENQRVGNTLTTFVTESGMYAVILRSDKPKARQFRKWITSDILPSLRKTGVYALGGSAKKPLSGDVVLLLQTIKGMLVHGDMKSVASKIGVTRMAAHEVLNGRTQSVRILFALYERALENKQNLSNLYLFPRRAIEKLTSIK
ncbi:hypothetical protein EZS27_004720 [termite gut metagenome]|uniref:Bro-N domain-containing protein n=1 Tax=termite gut metagenome TaxID=433724 RepID=A0A5J4SRX0_9ZZZZ